MLRVFPFWLCLLFLPPLLPLHAGEQPVVLVMGDSLSAAYRMPLERGWVSLLEQRLNAEGYPYRVVNASVSGETTAGGLTRLPPLLKKHRPEIVIIELGGNDGLRGIDAGEMRRNLAAMIEQSRAAGARVLLAGVYLPENYGPAYTEKFRKVYINLVREYEVALLPFLLDGVARDPTLMLDDGIHPNAAAQPRLLENVWPLLQPLLEGERAETMSDERELNATTEHTELTE